MKKLFVPLKHLIIFAHPSPESLSYAYKEAIVKLSEDAHHRVIVRDLHLNYFNPVMSYEEYKDTLKGKVTPEVKIEQDYVGDADLITFIYPIWWWGMPAIMKGYVERVFTEGFAYELIGNGEVKPLLSGKKIIIINNLAESYENVKEKGYLDAMNKLYDESIFELCGMNILYHNYFGNIDDASEEEKEGHIRTLETIYAKCLQVD